MVMVATASLRLEMGEVAVAAWAEDASAARHCARRRAAKRQSCCYRPVRWVRGASAGLEAGGPRARMVTIEKASAARRSRCSQHDAGPHTLSAENGTRGGRARVSERE